MPTPAYPPFVATSLTPSTTGPDVPVNAQINDNALAFEAAILGMLGWNPTITRSSGKVQTVVSALGVYRVKMTWAYHLAGPAIGKTDTITHEWSNDSGGTYQPRADAANSAPLGILTFAYDGSGVCTGATWS